MDSKFSRRPDALNKSIDRKLDRIEGRTAGATAKTGVESKQRSAKAVRRADETTIKAPRMIQKQASLHKPVTHTVVPAKPLVSLDAMPAKLNLLPVTIWSRHSIGQGSMSSSHAIRTCYRLGEGGRGYEEEQTSVFEAKMAEASSLNDSTIVVQMGDLKTATNDDLIQTSGMSDCCSVVLLTDFDFENKTYGKRSLIHIQGSSFECLEKPHELADQLCGLAKASSGKPLMILVTGRISSAFATHNMIIPSEIRSEDGKVRQPLMELMALCEVNILPLTAEITVWPDGSLMTKHDYGTRDNWNQPSVA